MICPDWVTALDESDTLAPLRAGFVLPAGCIYLNGNSLGPPPAGTGSRIAGCVMDEWGRDLVASWNRHNWIRKPDQVGALIAQLIGASPEEVVATCSVSANLLKTLSAVLSLSGARKEVLISDDEFPTDGYIADALARFGMAQVRRAPRAQLAAAATGDTAAILFSHVNYRTAEIANLRTMSDAARRAGAMTVVDLSHSTGAIPVDVNAAEVDFAVGCGYKYLNGGPGAPAFVFAASRHHHRMDHLLAGWMGHSEPFAFEAGYRPHPGARRFLSGTPPILAMVALLEGVERIAEAGVERLWQKSRALSELFLSETRTARERHGLELLSPTDPMARGSHLAFRHDRAFGISQALIAAGVMGDFRAPDCLRLGFAPAYLSYGEIWTAARRLESVLERGDYLSSGDADRGVVT